MLLPALASIGLAIAGLKAKPVRAQRLAPFVWLTWALAFFSIHRPWWNYYYIHLALPLCWCAAVAISKALSMLKVPLSETRNGLLPSHRVWRIVAFLTGIGVMGGWSATRVYFQVRGICSSPQIYSSLVLKDLLRFKRNADRLYTTDLVFSFHSGIPLPPNLAVVSLKRLWSGEMTNERIAFEVKRFRPRLILLRNDGHTMPFQPLLDSDYRVAYLDQQHKLYVLRSP